MSWAQPSEILQKGAGICIDIGCGEGVHRQAIENAGYKWVGVDLRFSRFISVQGDAHQLPFRSGSVSAVFVWQCLEHVKAFWLVIEEIYRVLKPGGMVFGSTSFLEPYHDFSFYGYSEKGLENLFAKFRGVEIYPGISCFALIPWTLSRRVANGKLTSLTVGFFAVLMQVFNCLYRILRRIWFFFSGEDHPITESYWFKRVPYEFAGHFLFRAQKP